MDYFIMETDKRLCRLPQIQFPQELFETGTMKTSVVYVKEHSGLSIDYADFLEKPGPLIADKFQKILQKYQQDMAFHRVMLIEKEAGYQKPYYLMIPQELICADKDESGYDTRGNVQDFVLDVEKVGKQRIFFAKDFNRRLIVRLDVAESILRREANGIWFEPVKISGRSK
ncbi:MAG: hypothetical protein NC123_14990 [Butyrivibrio sp.]|nr:hypothetical protein [Butyrivibrio sp.]